MEIKRFYLFALSLLLFSGCMSKPGNFETLEDFHKAFSAGPSLPPALQAGGVLTLKEALKTALVNNPTLQAALQAVQAARYGYCQALSAYAPEINASGSAGHTLSRGWELKNPPVGVMKKNDHFVSMGTIQASFLLFDGFARELDVLIARQKYNQSAADGKNIRRLLVRAVTYAYYDMILAEEEIRIYSEDQDFQNDALRQAEERFRNGHVSKASVLNFKILASRARSSMLNARYRRQTACHALTALMGYDPRLMRQEFRLEKLSAAQQYVIRDEGFYLELAIRSRPDLKAERILLDIVYRNRQKALADFLPKIYLFSEFSLNTYNAEYGAYRVSSARSKQGVFTYGAEGKWNLFRGFYSFNKLRREEVLEEIALRKLNAKYLEILAEVKDAHANCQNTRQQTNIYQRMTDWVREQRDLVYSEYQNGRETITRLNEAQSLLVEAQSRFVISAVQFNKAAEQLAAATGIDRL